MEASASDGLARSPNRSTFQVVFRIIAELQPYERNSRTHTTEQIAQVARSIQEYGWTNPILIDGCDMVIAGHARLEAAKLLGMTDVPTIRLEHLTQEQVRAYVIADNRFAELAGWDLDVLRTELSDLGSLGFDLALTGFAGDALSDLLPLDPVVGQTDDDDTPEKPVVPVSVMGDLWILGDHKVLCGDALSVDDVRRLMGSDVAQMVWTDPPYNVDYGNTMKDKARGTDRRILNDALGDDFGPFLQQACSNLLSVTDGAVYICMSSGELDRLQAAFREAGGHWSTFIIWAKDRFTIGRADYQRQYEPILYGWRDGSGHHWCGARDQSDLWRCARPRVNDLHPTMKPVELVERAVLNSSRQSGIVVDLFGGGGSTLIACHKNHRAARVMEMDPAYCDVIVRRWQDFTGEKALLAGGGTFDEVKAWRVPATEG